MIPVKKLTAILLLFAIAVCLCGCGGKTAITAEDFASRMREQGLVVEKYEGERGYFCYPKSGNCLVMFMELQDEDYAQAAFDRFLERSASETGSVTEKSAKHYAFYSKETDSTLYMTACVDNTFLYGEASLEDSDTLISIFKTTGYK